MMVFEEVPVGWHVFGITFALILGSGLLSYFVASAIAKKILPTPPLNQYGHRIETKQTNAVYTIISIVFMGSAFIVSLFLINDNYASQKNNISEQVSAQVGKVYGIELDYEQSLSLSKNSDGGVFVTLPIEDEIYFYGKISVIIDGEKVNIQLVKDKGEFKLIDADAPLGTELPKVKDGE